MRTSPSRWLLAENVEKNLSGSITSSPLLRQSGGEQAATRSPTQGPSDRIETV